MSQNLHKDNPETPGDRLRLWLIRIGMKQKDLADILGVSTIHLNNIINGRKKLTFDRACEISEKTSYLIQIDNNDTTALNPQWLMCVSDCMTSADIKDKIMETGDIFKSPSACASDLISATINLVTWDNLTEQNIFKHLENISVDEISDTEYLIKIATEATEALKNNSKPNIPDEILSKMRVMIESYAYNLIYSYLFNKNFDPLWNQTK